MHCLKGHKTSRGYCMQPIPFIRGQTAREGRLHQSPAPIAKMHSRKKRSAPTARQTERETVPPFKKVKLHIVTANTHTHMSGRKDREKLSFFRLLSLQNFHRDINYLVCGTNRFLRPLSLSLSFFISLSLSFPLALSLSLFSRFHYSRVSVERSHRTC